MFLEIVKNCFSDQYFLVMAGFMLAGMITAFVWGYVLGASQDEIDNPEDTPKRINTWA